MEQQRLLFLQRQQDDNISDESFAHFTMDHAKQIDYKELFVYRMLEKLDLGTAIEFIVVENDLDAKISGAGLLIASADLSYKTSSASPTSFTTFRDVCSRLQSQLKAQGLQFEPMRTALEAPLRQLFSTDIAMWDLKTIDLLCRLLHLSDVLTNVGNFGQVVQAEIQQEVGWRVVDFSVRSLSRRWGSDRYVSTYMSTHYRTVDEPLRYDDNPALRDALRNGAGLCDKIMDRLLNGTEEVASFQAILHIARNEVIAMIEAHRDILHLKEELHQKKIADLSAYADAALQNLLAV